MDPKRAFSSLLLKPAGQAFHEPCWRPAVDVYRSSRGWLVKVDLAGVRRGDVGVQVSGNILRVSGERRDRLQRQGHRVHSMEICYSSFERCVELPCDLERARLRWDFQDGMLLIDIDSEEIP